MYLKINKQYILNQNLLYLEKESDRYMKIYSDRFKDFFWGGEGGRLVEPEAVGSNNSLDIQGET